MKKFILASVALIAVFASCKKEDIRTVYKAEPAKATITVEVYDAFLGQNVTSQAKITANAGTVEGTQVVIVGEQANNFAIPQGDVKISAEFSSRKGSVTIPVPSIVEGGVAAYNALVIIGSPLDPSKSVEYVIEDAGSEYASGKKGSLEKATHYHAGKDWCINNTEFVLFGLTNYDEIIGRSAMTVEFGEMADGADHDYILYQSELLAKEYPGVTVTEKEYKYNVSAFSYFNVLVQYSTMTYDFDLYRINKLVDGSELKTLIGSIEVVCDGTEIWKEEIASPDHASHYVEGHGIDDPHYSHAHGQGGYNAGGGIVVAD